MYVINTVANAVLAIAERRETAHNDLEIVCAAYDLEVEDVMEVLGHLHFEIASPSDAMAAGVLIGLALARGDTPSEDRPRPDWWAGLLHE